MTEDDPKKSWWHTLPGIITGLTATITALGGLVVAINQTNWFSRPEPEATRPESEAATATGPSALAAQPEPPPAQDAPADAAVSDTATGDAATVTLPKMRSYTLGEVEFTLLDASLAPRNSESSTLTLRVRLLNNRPYPVNFWDSQFRLLVDGIPRAPNSGLNVVVAGNAADEGEVTFIVPRSATDPQLRILFADEKTDIPLPLSHGDQAS
jgi:hypothetical protein